MKILTYVAILPLVALGACKMNPPINDETTPSSPSVETEAKAPHSEAIAQENEGSLSSLLKKKKDAFLASAPQEKIETYDAGLQAIRDAGVLEQAVNTADEAPDFELINATGHNVKLSEQLQNGPVVLTWYRGGWCPYCNITLHYLQEQLPEFKKAGATLIALSPEVPDSSLSTAEKHNLEFEVLSDVGNKIAREYGVVFDLTPEVAEAYKKSFDIEAYNGDSSYQLPLAATYIIDKEGIVRYAFIDADYRNRAEPSELLKVLWLLQEK